MEITIVPPNLTLVTITPVSPIEVEIVPIGIQGPPGADGTLIHVGPTPPPSPSVNDLWVDTA